MSWPAVAQSSAMQRDCRLAAVRLALAGLMISAWSISAWAGDLTPQEQRGKQLYHEGVAADGTSITATIGRGSVSLPGTKLPCASCHGPDGLGRPDAGVVPSNVTWANLTKPYGLRHQNGRAHPPYTAEGVVTAVTSGVDPAGNTLDAAMPRYMLNDAAARDLLAYLERLGSDADQGVGANEIVVAAVLPGGGRFRSIGDVVGRLLSAYFDDINRNGGIFNRQIVLKTAAFDPSGSAVDALRRLTGESEIFAVVAPVIFGQNDALTAFTESAALPVVGPIAQYRRDAVERQSGTFYLTAGLDDQARVLVKYARSDLSPTDPKIAILSADDGVGLNFDDALRQESRDVA